MAYDKTFTLEGPGIAGNVIITLVVRPNQMDIDYPISVARHPIPGNTHDIIQTLGRGNRSWTFPIELWNTNLSTMSGGGVPFASVRDILNRLEIWAETGIVITFMSDYVTQTMQEASGVDVIIRELKSQEISSGDALDVAGLGDAPNYNVELTITRVIGVL